MDSVKEDELPAACALSGVDGRELLDLAREDDRRFGAIVVVDQALKKQARSAKRAVSSRHRNLQQQRDLLKKKSPGWQQAHQTLLLEPWPARASLRVEERKENESPEI